MQRIVSILILLACLSLLPAASATAWFFDDNTLVSIDGTNYSADDFKHWWQFWRDKDSVLPKTVDPYVNWLLLSQEGKRMQLDQDPGFKRQTRVFLQSRGLLMLKNDAVDSKIKVTDADIKERYQKLYTPLWLVQQLEFKDEATALAAYQEMKEGKISVDELVKREMAKNDGFKNSENWLRPTGIDPGWVSLLSKATAGSLLNPDSHEKGPVLYYLKEQKSGDDEDLAKHKEEIGKDLWKMQESALTLALLAELRGKYQVKVNEERLAALDINAADDTFTDEPVITTSNQNVSEKEFMVVIRRLISTRPPLAHAGADAEEARKLKLETANNIIAQSITNWESLDRHFEEKDPFKTEYDFNYNHRLVLGLEQRVFVPETKVTDEEIKAHYDAFTDRYTQPTVVSLYIVDESQAPIDKIWADVAVGKNFKQLLKQHYGQPIKPQEVPANHLDPEIKTVVDKLVDGETSAIFTAQGSKVMVHLEKRTPAMPLPLERVKETIRSQLTKEKFAKVRSEYLDSLKSRSKIDIREGQWKSIQKELGGA